MEKCVFCDLDSSVEKERRIYTFRHWELLLQQDKKRQSTKQSAGLLVSKRHITNISHTTDEEMTELRDIMKSACQMLCKAVGVTYMNQETVGFNQGAQAGQTVFHAHVHLLPVAVEDPNEMKVRAGIGGAFESLRKERMKL